MKLHIPNQSKQSIGGGWTFLNTFKKYAQRQGIEITGYGECDVVLISGATMVERDFVEGAKRDGKKIVFRIDNIPRNSRNRNTGTSRLFDFAQLADLIIYQSQWAKGYIIPFVKRDGPVILNGADTEIFNPNGPVMAKEGGVSEQFLFCQFNRDETKQFHQAWYQYILAFREDPKACLWLAGQFSPEIQQYNFDFFMGERFRHLGVIEEPERMAEIYRGTDHLLIPYFNDACSNTLIEFLNCHYRPGDTDHLVKIFKNSTGGTPEILATPVPQLSADHMTKRYIEEINKI